MILLQHEIEGATTPITIAPMGDIQWAGDSTDLAIDQIREHIARANKMGALYVGLGDYVDFMSPSNRESWKTGKFYDTSRKVVEDKARDLTDNLLINILGVTRGRWIGLTSGHHYFNLKDGRTTDTYLAEKLGAHFLGFDTAIVRLLFKDKTHRQAIDIWLAHGRGWGQTPMSPLTVLDRVSHYVDADIYVMGHQTKKCFASADRMMPIFPNAKGGKPRLGHRTMHLVGAGGWTRGYKTDENPHGTYVEQGLMRPVTLGAPLIHIRPRWRNSQSAGTKVWDANITVEA